MFFCQSQVHVECHKRICCTTVYSFIYIKRNFAFLKDISQTVCYDQNRPWNATKDSKCIIRGKQIFLILIRFLINSYKTILRVLQKILKSLSGTKVVSVAMVLHTSERELFICGPGPAYISLKALISNPSMKDFLLEIAKNVLDLVSKIMKSFFFKGEFDIHILQLSKCTTYLVVFLD